MKEQIQVKKFNYKGWIKATIIAGAVGVIIAVVIVLGALGVGFFQAKKTEPVKKPVQQQTMTYQQEMKKSQQDHIKAMDNAAKLPKNISADEENAILYGKK